MHRIAPACSEAIFLFGLPSAALLACDPKPVAVETGFRL